MIFIVSLKFSANKISASKYMVAHKEWIKRGIDDGIFLLVGSLQDGSGGCIVAHNTTSERLEDRLNEDPFVKENVVTVERFGMEPSLTDRRLDFLTIS